MLTRCTRAALALLVSAPLAAAQCEEDTLFASDPGALDNFGYRTKVSGDYALMTAEFDDSLQGADSGSAYVFELVGGAWTEVAKLTASDENGNDRFGFSGDIDGGALIVGARYNDDVGYGSGSAYVFERDGGGVWSETAKLTASDAVAGTLYGTGVAISGDTAIVGAELAPLFVGDPGSGAVYVYEKQAGVWTETQKLTASDAQSDDRFGTEVALIDNTMLIGARGVSDNGDQAGAAYVFTREAGVWTEAAKLLPDDGTSLDLFGAAVDVTDAPIATAVVGAPRANGALPETGAVYVFEREATSWVQTAKLLANNGFTGDLFGSTVAVCSERVLVGAWSEDAAGNNSGAVYQYGKGPDDVWRPVGKVLASDAQSGELFGHAVAIDGEVAMVGARLGNDPSGVSTGKAYVLGELDATTLPYGVACAGSGGIQPRLAVEGCPIPGGPIELSITDALGGSTALILFGLEQAAIPIGASGCVLNVTPLLPVSIPLPLLGSGPGDGSITLNGAIPVTAVGPVSLTMQALIADPAVPGNKASTNGVELAIP